MIVVLKAATLEGEKLKSGDVLVVQEGKLPPKVLDYLRTYYHWRC